MGGWSSSGGGGSGASTSVANTWTATQTFSKADPITMTPNGGTNIGYLAAWAITGGTAVGTLDMAAASTNMNSFASSGFSTVSRWGSGTSYDVKSAFNQTSVDLNSSHTIRFSNSTGTLVGTTYDLGISRNAVGVLEINNATAGTFADLRARNIRTAATTVASLTAAATAGAGARSFVTDATAPTFGATVAGGGAVSTPVYSDGTNWKVG